MERCCHVNDSKQLAFAVFYLRSTTKWPHTVKAHITPIMVAAKLILEKFKTGSLVPSCLWLTQMRLPMDKSESKNKNIEISH